MPRRLVVGAGFCTLSYDTWRWGPSGSTQKMSRVRGRVDRLSLIGCLHRHRHDHGRRAVGSFDEIDLLDLVAAVGGQRQVANLSAVKRKCKLRSGHIHPANVIGEVDSVR